MKRPSREDRPAPTRFRPRAALVGLLSMAVVVLAGCAPQGAMVREDAALRNRIGPSLVLLVEPDVELSLMTASGLLEPNAQWTRDGKTNVERALDEILGARNAALIDYRRPEDDPVLANEHVQIFKLNEAVGGLILMHRYAQFRLPTKEGSTDWTLGPDVGVLHDEYGADYGLFVFLRDSYATAGRVAVMLFAAALGVGIQGGSQYGFASLVDLRSGEVVWFNFLASPTGDLRTYAPARAAVEQLLSNLPL